MELPVVIGIGNPLMGDDGVGPYVVSLLQERAAPAELVALTTPGYDLITYLCDKKKAWIVDAAVFGGRAGEVRRFEPSRAVSRKNSSGVSLHDGDLLSILDYANLLGVGPSQVTIYCVQAEREGPGEGLSPEIKAGAEEACALILQELRG